jgi:hypothetical protein
LQNILLILISYTKNTIFLQQFCTYKLIIIMGFLSSLKRLLFTTESVAKSAVDNAVDYTKDKAEDLTLAAKETATEFAEKTAGLRESVIEKANAAYGKVETVVEGAWDKTKEVAEEVAEAAETAMDKVMDITDDKKTKVEELAGDAGEFVQSSYVGSTETSASGNEQVSNTLNNIMDRAKDSASNLAEKIAESELVQKVGEIAETVGSKAIETGEVVADKAAEITEKVGSKVLETSDKTWERVVEAKDALAEKAKEVAAQVGKKFDETVEKAEVFMSEENAKPKSDFAEETLSTGGDLLSDKEDFFSKASQYADGDYDAFSEGKITVVKEKATIKEPAKAAGQEDHDGDGNEQIDDAIIVEG